MNGQSTIPEDADQPIAIAPATMLLGKPMRSIALIVNAPGVFARPDFMEWLNKDGQRVLSYHPKGQSAPDEFSDTVVLVDSNYEGDSSDMPEDVWRAICDLVYDQVGSERLPRSLDTQVHVRLTNLEE